MKGRSLKVKKVLLAVLAVMLMMVIFIPVAFASDGETVAGTSTLDAFLAIVLLALVVEKIAEAVKTGLSPLKPPGWVWFIVTAFLGIALCILFQVNLFIVIGLSALTPASFIVGCILTGVAVGSGSGFVHDLIDKLKSAKIPKL